MIAPVLFNLFVDDVIGATMSAHPGVRMRMLCSLEGPLVGNRRKYCIFLKRSPGVYFLQDFLDPGV